MPEAFSFNREFDFIRLDGLNRVTGRPPHEWDIYIIKELIDNALDADEALWGNDKSLFPKINIKIEYINLPDNRRQLIVQVENRAVFPPELIKSVFNPGWYTSRKAFIKGLTRGSLGNALKTLLGIPYALRNRAAGDYIPQLKPLSIQCENKEYLPRYLVDKTSQTINLEVEENELRKIQGTIIRVGVDHFSQEIPRQLNDLQQLAEQYHWCNPHAEFSWKIELYDQKWSTQFPNDPEWDNKYQGTAPIQWYTPVAFQDLITAIYRKQFSNKKDGKLTIKDIIAEFGNDKSDTLSSIAKATSKEFNKAELLFNDIETDSTNLYRLMFKNSPKFDSATLGYIGEDHIRLCLNKIADIEGSILFTRVKDHQDPNVPFVLEIYAAHLKEGRRQIFTSINFTPTYGDPFFRRWLDAPAKPEDPVLGLRGFMDAYGFDEEAPVIVYIHLICPTIEHAEYSKTEINHLPFKHALGSGLDGLLNELIDVKQEMELKVEQLIFNALDEILHSMEPDERFVPDQLLERLRKKLGEAGELDNWLEMPDAIVRLRSYITKYQSDKPVVTHWAGLTSEVTIPSHPDRHFSIPAEQINNELLKSNHVNKIIYIHSKEIEPVVIDNGWLCQMDMALLQKPSSMDDLETLIVQCLASTDVPILILHNADDDGYEAVKHIRESIETRQMQSSRIVDLGLHTGNNQAYQPSRLVELMPSELAMWLVKQLNALNIHLKATPPLTDIRKDIRRHFDNLLLSRLWEGMYQELKVVSLLDSIDNSFDISKMMQTYEIDQNIIKHLKQDSCKDSYETALQILVNKFYEGFMEKNDKKLGEIVKSHIANGRKPSTQA